MKAILKVLGVGSAFTPQLTNTSFLLTIDTNSYLIDCGYNVFAKLLEMSQSNIQPLHMLRDIYITHLHDDHIGSLGTLLFYQYFAYGIKLVIYTGENVVLNLKQYLSTVIDPTVDCYELKVHDHSFPILHKVNPCCGFNLNIFGKHVVFTGDTRKLQNIDQFKYCKAIFHDISYEDTGVHATINDINSYPEWFQKKLVLVHHDNVFDVTQYPHLYFASEDEEFEIPYAID